MKTMTKSMLLAGLLGLLLVAKPALAQSNFCSAHSDKLYCALSDFYGNPNPDPFSAISSALGSQLSQIPLASPASGIIYSTDPSLGIPRRSGSDTFGPVLTERGETIGRHKLFLSFTYQRFSFSSIDGVNLKQLPIVFNFCDASTGECGQLATKNRVDPVVNQFAAFATFGLFSRVDISIAVPILDMNLNAGEVSCTVCQTQRFSDGTQEITAPGSISRSASGIGDIVLRAKGLIRKGERFRLSGGVDVRIPTGDELNFLGTGAKGVKPFIAASWRARVAPHVNLGYQWNGDSAIAGSVPGTKGKLPDSFFYNGGFDVRAAKRLTVAADFLGDRVFDAKRVLQVTAAGQPSIAIVQGSFNTAKGALGVKVNPIGNLLISANVLVRFDHNGLRNRPVPLIGLSYTF
jgi:hypothetical protein